MAPRRRERIDYLKKREDDTQLAVVDEPTRSMTLLGQPIFVGRTKQRSETFTSVKASELMSQVNEALRGRAKLKDVDLIVYCGCDHLQIKPFALREDHSGLMRFESALGVGTTVTVWLPRTPDPRWES